MISVERTTDKSVFMSKVEAKNLLLCGDNEAVSKFRKYLGFQNPVRYRIPHEDRPKNNIEKDD